MKDTILLVDIGNTTVVFNASINDKILSERTSIKNTEISLETVTNLLNKYLKDINIYGKIDGVIISSVVPSLVDKVLLAIKKFYFGDIKIINPSMKSDVIFDIDNKDELGSDLLADLQYCYSQNKFPCLIVDMGTVTKFLFIDKEKKFSSALFYPGVRSCLQSFFKDTELLPQINSLNGCKSVVSKNTIDAINNGLFYGTLGVINNIVSKFEMETNYKFHKILSGGYAKIFIGDLDGFEFVENLTLEGIKELYKLNK